MPKEEVKREPRRKQQDKNQKKQQQQQQRRKGDTQVRVKIEGAPEAPQHEDETEVGGNDQYIYSHMLCHVGGVGILLL